MWRIANDDADRAFQDFVRWRSPAMLRTAYLLTGDQHLAEDLVQEALARTHRARRRLVADGHFEAYARTAMHHLQVSWWRRKRVVESPRDELVDVAEPGSDHAARISLRVSLHHGLAQLTRRQRAVLVLRFFDDRSEAETAELLGCSVGTVKSQTSKALARLRAVPELSDRYQEGASDESHRRPGPRRHRGLVPGVLTHVRE